MSDVFDAGSVVYN